MMPGLDAGKLRDRVAIERHNLIDNGRGGRKVPDGQSEWVEITPKPIAAEVIALRGEEALRQSAERSIHLWRVTIRARRGLDTSHRLVWESDLMGRVVMNIRAMAPNDERDGIVMTCESGVPS